ncbi:MULTISPECIES: enoyl-CoA hydratase/isomerase family protein [Nocardia]|uniref:enoyl-CoA hydratase/isomerase family protein n=1 Tax=Nocardia TaxID=1817 RepID=UPI001893D5A8|nr:MULTISPECIES: enoyl-CoA hydratase/isomerase family protein [Nocardia]MBF6347552.1 enoyl-CoA hydratase/isomerase family protein [Nocardia flavorosea]
MGIEVRTLAAAELAAGTAGEFALDANTLLAPLLLIDLSDTDEATATAAAARIPALGGPAVGFCSGGIGAELAPLTSALDLTYAEAAGPADRAVVVTGSAEHAVAEFADCVRRYPQAASIAAQVVRASEGQPVPAAIDVESFAYSTLQGGPEFGRWLAERRRLGRPLPPPPETDPVLLTADGDTLRITLNRPERRNAYGTALRDALVDALRTALLAETFGRIVLDGAGTSFCSGGDLDEFGHTPDTATAHLIRTRGGAARSMARLAARTEVRLHGHCVGAGIEVSAFAGRIVAAPDTVIRLPEVAMGLIPGAGGTVSVPRRIGRWRALHLFVTGAALGPQQALEWGLVDAIAGAHPR